MGLNIELKIHFYSILTQHSFIKKIFQLSGGYVNTAAMQNNAKHKCIQRRTQVCIGDQCVCLSGKSLYVGLASGTEIVVVASR